LNAVVALMAILLAATHGRALSDAQRAEWKRAVERTRYQFVLGEKPPFDQVYPLSFFQKQVQQEHERELVLKRIYGVSVTPGALAYEYDRIEKSTKAPEQWDVIKNALKNDRWLIEQIVCRPILAERVLRAKFNSDPNIHAALHEEARRARAKFLAGEKATGAKVIVISRKGEATSTDAMLKQAQAESALRRVLTSAEDRPESPRPIEPEAAALLEKQLRKPDDVSNILEYSDRFEVYRLLENTSSTRRVELVVVPKRDFDEWYASVRKQIAVQSRRAHRRRL